MKKILLLVCLGMVLPVTAGAEELVVNLRSGNALVIQYTGTIQGVTLQGESDAIVGMNMTAKPVEPQVQPSGGHPQGEVQADTRTGDRDPGGSGIRLKWADPRTED